MSNLLKDPIRRASLFALTAGLIAAVLLGVGLVVGRGCWLGLEFAGNADDFTQVLTEDCHGEAEQTTTLLASMFIVGTVLLAIVCWVGCQLIYAGQSDRFLHVARRIAVVASLLCVFEFVTMLVAIGVDSTRDLLAPVIEATAHLRWVSTTITVVGSAAVVVPVYSALSLRWNGKVRHGACQHAGRYQPRRRPRLGTGGKLPRAPTRNVAKLTGNRNLPVGRGHSIGDLRHGCHTSLRTAAAP